MGLLSPISIGSFFDFDLLFYDCQNFADFLDPDVLYLVLFALVYPPLYGLGYCF